jgi:hypothetical protein
VVSTEHSLLFDARLFHRFCDSSENKHVGRGESIRFATRKMAFHVIMLYTLIVFTVGLNAPYNDENLWILI